MEAGAQVRPAPATARRLSITGPQLRLAGQLRHLSADPDSRSHIPLIKGNLAPLSFADVPRQAYTEAVLGVYELTRIDLLKDVFIWAYLRSADRYAAIRQSLGEPDPFRLRYREQFRELIADLVRTRVSRKDAVARIAAWSRHAIDPDDRRRFAELAEAELTSLHEGNFARYRIRPSEFAAWREVWEGG